MKTEHDPAEVRRGIEKLRREHVHPDDRLSGDEWKVDVYEASSYRQMFWRAVSAAAKEWSEERWEEWLASELDAAVLPDWISKTRPSRFYAATKAVRGKLASVVHPKDCAPLETPQETASLAALGIPGWGSYVPIVTYKRSRF